MRNLTRSEIVPPTLARVAAKTHTPSSPYWREPDVRGTLRAIQGQSCAYCQSSMEGRMRPGTVDHFRPTSRYLWLSYRIENLILACHDCNSRVKNSDFPIDQSGSRAESDDDLPSELRLLLDPFADPIDQRLGIDYLDKRFSFQNLVTNRDSIEYRCVSKTIEVLRFDQGADPTYRKIRAQVLGRFAEKIERHKKGSLSLSEQSDLRREVCRWKPFGEMAQGLIRFYLSESEADKLCPSFVYECLWLIDDLVTVFDEVPTTDDAERQQEEVRWCLAALLKSPPGGVSEDVVREKLESLNMLSEIEERSSQLEQ